jgi:integrase
MSHRILTAISQVMRYAVVTERAERNPCQDLRGALQPSRSRSLPSITDPVQIAGLLHAIDEYSGSFIVRSALQLAPLVFVRPGELRNAKWADMDMETSEWLFRHSKQRASVEDKRKLVVPLSSQAVAVLERLRPLTGGGTINKALRTMGYDTRTEITGHGFRAMARTVIPERLRLDTRWIELQLSHRTTESLGESYDRAQYLDDRRKMMQAWADYLDGLKEGGAKPAAPVATRTSPPKGSPPPTLAQGRRGRCG